MNVRRVLLAGLVVCLGFARWAAFGQAPVPDDAPEALAAELARAKGPAKPWKQVRGFGRVLDFRKLPVVIDEPGLYAIDRNWEFPKSAANGFAGEIQITADDVTVDLHGFSISADPRVGTLLVVSGNAVEIRNGRLSACCSDGAVAVDATIGLRLHHLLLFSYEKMQLGEVATITDSILALRVGLELESSSTLQRNQIDCNRGDQCVVLLGERNTVSENKLTLFQGGGIRIDGDANVVTNNIVDARDLADEVAIVIVQGDQNVVSANTVVPGGNPAFAIGGTANTLDGNIVAPVHATGRSRVGMEFTRDGNFYGDNRMAAQVPFALGGTVQTDWGGNVGY